MWSKQNTKSLRSNSQYPVLIENGVSRKSVEKLAQAPHHGVLFSCILIIWETSNSPKLKKLPSFRWQCFLQTSEHLMRLILKHLDLSPTKFLTLHLLTTHEHSTSRRNPWITLWKGMRRGCRKIPLPQQLWGWEHGNHHHWRSFSGFVPVSKLDTKPPTGGFFMAYYKSNQQKEH